MLWLATTLRPKDSDLLVAKGNRYAGKPMQWLENGRWPITSQSQALKIALVASRFFSCSSCNQFATKMVAQWSLTEQWSIADYLRTRCNHRLSVSRKVVASNCKRSVTGVYKYKIHWNHRIMLLLYCCYDVFILISFFILLNSRLAEKDAKSCWMYLLSSISGWIWNKLTFKIGSSMTVGTNRDQLYVPRQSDVPNNDMSQSVNNVAKCE